MDLQTAHQTRFTVVLLFRVCRQAHNEGLELNYRCTVLWYDTVRCRQTNGSTSGSLNTLQSGVIVWCRHATWICSSAIILLGTHIMQSCGESCSLWARTVNLQLDKHFTMVCVCVCVCACVRACVRACVFSATSQETCEY